MTSPSKKLIQVLATREGGGVHRCHVFPKISNYTVGSHSYGATSLLLLLHPNPSLSLIKAVQWHDVAERWMGDMPSPVKSVEPELKEVYEAIEARYLQTLGLLPSLTFEEQQWLRAIDILELWLWSREERHLGNQYVQLWVDGLYARLTELSLTGQLPHPIRVLVSEVSVLGVIRLPERFSIVEGMIVKATSQG